MNFNPNEPPNGDFAAYVEALVKQAGSAHAGLRHDSTMRSQTAKPAGGAQAKSAPRPHADAQAQAVLEAAREHAGQQVIGKLKGWLVKGAIGAVALFVLLPMVIDWWDKTDDPSSLGVVLVLGAIALRWWFANRHR